MVHTGSRLEGSNDQDMDYCKTTVVCEPWIVTGDKATEGGVLAKKRSFEAFCTELEAVSSVEKEMFD